MSVSIAKFRHFIEAEHNDSLIQDPTFYSKKLQQQFGERFRGWHFSALQCLRDKKEDVLIKTGRESDKLLIYQALAQSKPNATLLVISSEEDMMEAQVSKS
jgi:hypothetical protein